MKLVNEDGTIVGRDPDTDETVPVDFESVQAESLSAGSVSAGSFPDVSTVHLDGRDPQTVVDEVGQYTKVVGDPTNIHDVSSPVTVTTNGVQLEGLALRVEDGAEVDCIDFRADHGRVRNCRLNGNRRNQSDGVAGIEDANGVTVTNCTDVIVEGNFIVQQRAQGILVSSFHSGRDGGGPVSHVRVRDNTIDGVWNGGILAQGGGNDPCEYVWVENNEVRNFKNEGIQAIDGCGNVWFTNNHVVGETPGMVIEQHGGRGVDRPIRNVNFVGNRIDVSSDAPATAIGFEVSYGADSIEDVTIRGNRIDVTDSGISLGASDWGEVTIADNTVVGDGDGEGIWITPDSLDGIDIRNNRIEGFETGIYKIGQPLVQGSVVGNRLLECEDAIVWEDSPGATIRGNVCRVSNRGIVVASDDGDVHGVTVTGNQVEEGDGATAAGIETVEDGGELDHYLIKDNSITVSGTAVNDAVSAPGSDVGPNIVY